METTTAIQMPGIFCEGMWDKLQKEHPLIPRWKDYIECNPGLTRQTNIEHVFSVERLFHECLPFLEHHRTINRELLLLAIHVHEDGEALLQGDVLWHNKDPKRDLLEFKAFKASIQNRDEWASRRDDLETAFLLQFITGDIQIFEDDSEDTRDAIRAVQLVHHFEGRVFNALEKMDYYIYAKRGYDESGDVVILTHVLRNHTKPLDEYANTIRGFKEHVWTEAHSEAAKEFMERYADIPGPKDPGGIPAAYEWAYQKGYMRRPLQIGVIVDKSPAFGVFGDDPRGCA